MMNHIKLILSVSLLFSTLFIGMSQEIENLTAEQLASEKSNLTSKSCYEASIKIFKNGQEVGGVASECYGDYSFEIEICSNCRPTSPTSSINCYDYLTLSFNGIIIDVFQWDKNKTCQTITGSFGQFPMGDFGTPSILSFDLKINTTCYEINPDGPNLYWTLNSHVDIPFNFVSQEGGNIYTKAFWGSVSDIQLEFLGCDVTKKAICCNPKSYFSIVESGSITNTKTTSQGGNITVSSALKFDALGLSNSIVGSYTFSSTSAEIISNSESFSINQRIYGQDDACVLPGYQLVKQAFIEEYYVADCNGTEIYIDEKKEYIPIYVIPSNTCVFEPQGGCPPIQNIIPTKGIKGGGEFSVTSTVPCSGFIDLEIEDTEGLTVGWTGPNGFTSSDFSIDNLEIGEYEYTVTNECCEEVTGTVVLCDDLDYGPWVYNEGDMEYCRVVSCQDPTTAAGARSSDCETIHCVSPDETIETIDGGNCIQQHYYEGEYLGFIIIQESSIEISFDEFTQQCQKLTYCGGDIVSEDYDFPVFEPWQFDYGSNKCTRVVICFGEVMDEPNTKEPEIIESYNEFTGLCEKTAYCDAFQIGLPPSPPSFTGPWMWSQFDGCTQEIKCSFDSNPETIQGQESFSNWTFNEFTNMCESAVSCNNINMPGAINTVFPQSIGTWSYNNSKPFEQQCSRVIFCSGNLITQESAPNFVNGPTCQCNSNGVVVSYYIYCKNTYIDYVPCPDPNDCLTDGDTDSDLQKAVYLSNQIAIYPNPVLDNLHFSELQKDESYQVRIYDLLGVEQFVEVLQSDQLSIKHLPAGAYILHLYEGDQMVKTQKIIKI